jgi:hypothetical protein
MSIINQAITKFQEEGMIGFMRLAIQYTIYSLKNQYHRISNPKLKSGFYEITIEEEDVRPFIMYLPFGKDSNDTFANLPYRHNQRIYGAYEPDVMSELVNHIDSDTCFWEIGAQFGYFSLAVSTIATCVVSIEALPQNVEIIKRSASKNEFENLYPVQAEIGKNRSLDEIVSQAPEPDVVLMDIEGWELKAIQEADSLLDEDITWIIEAHRNPQPRVSPVDFHSKNVEKIIDILKKEGYSISTIGEDTGTNNIHIVARNDC